MIDVFISYKRERRPAARHLQKVLKLHGFEAWYDYGLIPGEDFEARLMVELRAAKVCLVLWCEMSVRSPWVIREATEARKLNTFLPVWIEKTTPPPEFSRAHTIDLTSWQGAPRSNALDPLLLDIARRVGRSPEPDFEGLKTLHEDWVGFGKPSLVAFGLTKSLDQQDSVTSESSPSVNKRFAYVIAIDGGKLKEITVRFLLEQSLFRADNILSSKIAVSDDFTGILDYGRNYSSIEMKSGAFILIHQKNIFEAIDQFILPRGGDLAALGITFELNHTQSDRDHNATEFPIEDCIANVLVTRKLQTLSDNDLSNLIQQLFWIHEVDSAWFWNSSLAPASKAVSRLVLSDRSDLLKDFIETVDPTNSMNARNQLIDLAWHLIHNYSDWIEKNVLLVSALKGRGKDFPKPLLDKLTEIANK